VWAAVSRAIRQPARVENGIQLELSATPVDSDTVLSVRLNGSPNFRSEELRDLEAGYRAQWSPKFSLDATAYMSFYRRLSTMEMQPPRVTMGPSGVRIEQLLTYDNKGNARNYGGEVWLNWAVSGRWRISASYAMLHLNPSLAPDSTDYLSLKSWQVSPCNQIGLQSQVNLWRNLEWDQTLAWVQRLENAMAPGYLKVDSRLGWRFGEGTHLSLVGQNLVNSGYSEFPASPGLLSTMTSRKVFGRISWTF
jgi:iron complex outermembrane receptor protein